MPPKVEKKNATAPAPLEARQECLNAQNELPSSPCKELSQKVGDRLAETATKNPGLQMAKLWAPSVKDDEKGQKQRIREPVESVVNDDEPPEDAFGPYPTEPKIKKYKLDDGTILFVDVRTGRAVADEDGNSIEVQSMKEADSDQEMMEDGEEHSGGETDSEAHGHDDSDDDPDDDAHGDDDGDDE